MALTSAIYRQTATNEEIQNIGIQGTHYGFHRGVHR